MSKFDNFWRLGTAQALAVASVGGAVASSAAFGTQTYAIQVNFPGSVSSTGGCRIAIVDPGTTVSSTVGTLLWPTARRSIAARLASASRRSATTRGRSRYRLRN
jgi:hypothetical protein